MDSAERSVLGAAMLDPRAAALACNLRDTDFNPGPNRLIFAAIKKVHGEGGKVDPLTVMDALGGDLARVGGIEHLTRITLDTISAANVEWHIQIVREQRQRREFISGMGKALNAATAGDDYLADARKVMEDITRQSGSTLQPIREDMADALEYMYSNSAAMQTGYVMLDAVISGFRAKQLIVLAGTTRTGKTAFALNIALNVSARGNRVLVFSLEMGKEELIQRMVAIESGVNFQEQFGTPALVQEFMDCAERLKERPIYIDDRGGVSMEYVRSQCYAVKPDLVIIDYLGLMRTEKRGTREQEVSELTHALKAFAKEIERPILLLCQLSRRADQREKEPPRLSDLRESGAIEQDADCVILLHRPALADEHADKTRVIVDVAKNRNGMGGKIELKWDGPHFKFWDMETDEATPFEGQEKWEEI